MASFREADLPLHPFQPIRRNVIRGGREWVPAILRYNRIPARVLIEVCNLNNPGRPQASPHAGVPREGGGGDRRRARRVLRGIGLGAAGEGGCGERHALRRPALPRGSSYILRAGGRMRLRRLVVSICAALAFAFAALRVGAGLEGPRPRRRSRQERQGRARRRRHGQAPLGEEQPRRARCDDGREGQVGVLRHRRRSLGHRLRGAGLPSRSRSRSRSWRAAATNTISIQLEPAPQAAPAPAARGRAAAARGGRQEDLSGDGRARSRPATRRSRRRTGGRPRELRQGGWRSFRTTGPSSSASPSPTSAKATRTRPSATRVSRPRRRPRTRGPGR